MENRAGAYAGFFASRGAKVVANDTGCDVHVDEVDAAVENVDAAIYNKRKIIMIQYSSNI